MARIHPKKIQLQRTQMQENKIIREVKKQRPYRFSKESEGGPGSKSNGGERELVSKDPTSSCKSVGSWPLASQAFLRERWPKTAWTTEDLASLLT